MASPTLPHRVRDCAPSQIWAAYEAVRAYDPVLPWADVETLHRLRIAAKWLRYDLEFFGEALGAGLRTGCWSGSWPCRTSWAACTTRTWPPS